jgi:hypothetical protein
VNRWRSTAAILLAALCIFACQVLIGLEQPTLSNAGADAMSNDAPFDAPFDAGPPFDPCQAGPDLPPPTGIDDDPNTDLPPLAFLIRNFRFTAEDGGLAGFNLDRDCRCSGSGTPPCTALGDNLDVQCDGDGGIDNALAQASAASFLKPEEADKINENGGRSLLVVLSRYNGRANDSSVRVSLGRSSGLYSDNGCDGQPRGRPQDGVDYSNVFERDGGRSPRTVRPVWDGCDEWYVPKEDLDPLNPGEFPRSSTGYVTNGWLVVPGGQAAPFSVGEIRFDLREPRFRARLEALDFGTDGGLEGGIEGGIEAGPTGAQDGGAGFRLRDITVAGTADLGSLIRSFGTLPSGTAGAGLVCQEPLLYNAVIGLFCSAADLPGELSRVGQGERCSAVSMGAFAIGDPVRMQISDRFAFDNKTDCGELLKDEKACPVPADAAP